MSTSLRVAVVGASGYTGEELVRLVARHPRLRLEILTSRQFAGRKAGEIIADLPDPVLNHEFRDLAPADLAGKADVILLALPHGVSSEYATPLRAVGAVVIDLSADFRIADTAVYREFYGHEHAAPHLLGEAVYGLPELYRAKITTANLIACPGCYPTSILLALAPALREGLVDLKSIVINSASGVSGAGKKPEIPLLFVEVNDNIRAYNVPKHRHLGEIEQELSALAGSKVRVTFIPHLAPLSRGMISSIVCSAARKISETELEAVYHTFYKDEPFVSVKTALPEAKLVARTNKAELAVRVDERTNRLLFFSAIDNLGKGAAGQAIQALNIRFGYEETMGLNR